MREDPCQIQHILRVYIRTDMHTYTYITLHSITLPYVTLHHSTLQYIAVHYIAF